MFYKFNFSKFINLVDFVDFEFTFIVLNIIHTNNVDAT